MFIVPLSGITPLEDIKSIIDPVKEENVNADESVRPSFADLFNGLINNVQETNAQVDKDAYEVALGNMDDLHTVTTNIAKAETALELLVTVKNKAIESYNEILRMSI